MNRTTTGLCLAALLVSCSMNSVLRADELLMRDNFFVADETRHQWVNADSQWCAAVIPVHAGDK